MKAVISSTYDNLYYYFLPITVFCWNKIGVDVICFMPYKPSRYNFDKYLEWAERSMLIHNTILKQGLKCDFKYFVSDDHKQATYAQCLRNYAACLDLLEDELLVTSDVDMALFKIPAYIDNGAFSVFGFDLTPPGQYPQCYVTAPVKVWREAFNIKDKTYQQAIDALLGEDECQDYRGCRWSVDQEQSFLNISKVNHNLIPRAKPNTQFATKRYDRDDSFILDRLSLDTIDYHMNRPGFEDKNFLIILTILKYHYPNDNFDWLITYNSEYKKLI